MKYGQFCPIAKSLEILGEKWSLLIIRELLMGARRYNELQRGLGSISPALLSKRLTALTDRGVIIRRRIPGQRGFEYFPADACKDLLPILRSLGNWGMRWARENLVEDDYDVELLMLYLERSIAADVLPDAEITLSFFFRDLKKQPRWWLLVDRERTEVCVKDPGRDIDVYFTSTVKAMTDVWLGHRSYANAIRAGDLKVTGLNPLVRTVGSWLRCTEFRAAS